MTPIQSSIESLRRRIVLSIEALPVDEGPGERRSAINKLISAGMLGESLALLQISEANIFAWQELRLHRIRDAEPDHLEATLRSARELLDANRQADAAPAAAPRTALDDYAHIDAFEVPWKIHARSLAAGVESAQAEMLKFAAARGLEEQAIQTQTNATLADTAREALGLASEGGRTVLEQGRRTGQILGDRASRARTSVRECVRDRTERRELPRPFNRTEE